MTDLPPPGDRFESRAMTLLDVAAVLLLAASAGWGAWVAWHPALGLACAGLTLVMLSSYAQHRNAPRPVKVPPGAHPHREFPPGPEDAGPLHVKGR